MTRRWLVRSFYLLAALCLVIGLSPLGRTRPARSRVVALLDVSRSVMPDASRDFLRLSARLTPLLRGLDVRSVVHVDAYARRPIAWLGPLDSGAAVQALEGPDRPALAEADLWNSRPDRALRRASIRLGSAPGGHVILVTDGQGAGRLARDEAAALAARGHRLWVVPVPRAPGRGDLFLEGVEAPTEVRPGAPVRFRIRVGGTDAEPRRFRIVIQDLAAGAGAGSISREGLWPGRGTSELELVVPGNDRETVRRFLVRLEEPGARLADRNTPADRTRVAVRVGSPILICWMGRNGASPPRALAGLGPGFALDTDRLTRESAGHADVIVVEDMPIGPPPLTRDGVRMLSQVVSRGTGFLALGGRRSFGPGGWGGTELEAMLPVRMEPPGPEQDITMILDASGSMASENRWRRALLAVRAFLSTLRGGDRIRMLVFSARVQEIAAWTPVPARGAEGDREAFLNRVEARLGQVRPHGSTRLVPALDAALAGFADRTPDSEEHPDRRRRILLFSDGQLGEGVEAYRERGEQLDRASIRVGVVATGASLESGGRERFLALTRDGRNGRLVQVQRDEDLAEAFQRAGNPDRWMVGDLVVTATSAPRPPGLELMPPLPRLGLIVRVTPDRSGATCLAVGPEESPVLVVGRHGEGRVAAWPAGLREPNSQGWNRPACWTGLVRWLARRDGTAAGRASGVAHLRQDRLRVRVQVPEGSDLSGWQVRLADRAWTLEPCGPQQLAASGPAVLDPEDGSFLVLEKDGARAGIIPVHADPGEELRESGSAQLGLEQLARAGHGRILDPGGEEPAWPPPSEAGDHGAPGPLWPLLGLGLFLVGWALNRLRR